VTSLLEGARRLVTRGSDIGARIEALSAASSAARGRLDPAVVDQADLVAGRAADRLRLSADHTVVAIAGATGSGKSSTFNALIGLELSSVGVRRPTTSWATACVWGSQGADELLSWLSIPPRHQTRRDSLLDTRREDNALDGVVLLDLPDHDSTEVAHHLEVDRLVQLADLMIWVLDPQKYADAAIHDRYLAPLHEHAEVTVVVLNQIDTVQENRRQAMVDDVRRLLDADGLHAVPIFAISARHGLGVPELRTEVAKRVADKKSARTRLDTDLKAAAQRLAEAHGQAKAHELTDRRAATLEDAFADAAGVPTVVSAVERATRIRAGRATGWPVVSWLSRLRRDPLKKLNLELGAVGKQLSGKSRTSLPTTTPVQRARVDAEVRALADLASEGLSRPWADAVRRASASRLDELNDRLDKAMADTDLHVAKIPVWAGAVRMLQWLLILTAIAGGGWLVTLTAMDFLELDKPDLPKLGELPIPTLMLVGGVLLGILLALVCRGLVRMTARRRAAAADKRLRESVHDVAVELVVQPVRAELEAHAAVGKGIAQALK
jgi:GTPase Era involved in 16S rRNA processing